MGTTIIQNIDFTLNNAAAFLSCICQHNREVADASGLGAKLPWAERMEKDIEVHKGKDLQGLRGGWHRKCINMMNPKMATILKGVFSYVFSSMKT